METLDRLISSRSEFHAALESAFMEIARQGSREVFMCGDDFLDWPLDRASIIDALKAWSLPHRHFHILARDYAGLPVRHPRWVAWRRTWSHVVHCRGIPDVETGKCPTLVIAPGLLGLRLSDSVHFRGRLLTTAADIRLMKDQFDAVSQHSEDAFPASTLGL